MLLRRALCLVLAALVGLAALAGCATDDEFQTTVVGPFQTLAVLTPGPALYATLTARAPAPAQLAQALTGGLEPATATPAQIDMAPTDSAAELAPPATATALPGTPTGSAVSTPEPATPTPPPTATPLPPTSTPPPTAADVMPPANAYINQVQHVGELGDVWSLSDLRVGIHPEIVRLVWELGEDRDSAPLTEVVEVDNAVAPFPRRGSLHDPAWGAARIDVMLSDVYAYDVPLGEWLPTSLPGIPAVTQIGVHPTFDDALLGFSIGLARPLAYEVFTLTDPVRIVVDVRIGP